MKKMNGESINIANENIEKLKELFPEVFSEGKINFTKLEEELGEFTDSNNERYNFTWSGKNEAKKIAQTPSTGTLLPCKKDSKDWDTTQNLYIEGDNLEVLKLLQKSYQKQIKIIYIDPPYNTGRDFVYKDNFKDNIKNYLEQTGQVDNEGNRLSTNSDTSGRYHSDWLSMMYPRLKLARNLLKDDGIIFISIDDNEVSNLRKLCDEIFGEDNFRNSLIIKRGAKSVQSQFDTWDKLGSGYETVLMYSKVTDYRFPKQLKQLNELKGGSWNNHWRGTDRPTMRYELFGITPDKGQWRWGKERSIKGIENYDNMISEINKQDISQDDIDRWYLDKDEDIDLLRLSKNNKPEHFISPSNTQLLNDVWFDFPPNSSSILSNLFNGKIFDNPKPFGLLFNVFNFGGKNDIVLDFFSGSATTAHTVMKQNIKDGGNRKYICVQIPEETDEKSEAFKNGYKTICEIGKERIRRAGEKIKEDNKKKDLSNLDIGFKVFKLDSSNIKEWDSDFDNLEQTLEDSVENIKPDRTSEDLLYEILLKYGLDLTLPIEEKIINNKKVFVIGYGALIVCLDDDITSDIVEEIGKLKEAYETDTMRVVFKDSSFRNAVDKTNSIEILKQFNIDEVVSI